MQVRLKLALSFILLCGLAIAVYGGGSAKTKCISTDNKCNPGGGSNGQSGVTGTTLPSPDAGSVCIYCDGSNGGTPPEQQCEMVKHAGAECVPDTSGGDDGLGGYYCGIAETLIGSDCGNEADAGFCVYSINNDTCTWQIAEPHTPCFEQKCTWANQP
jgi:hypothetical protein